VEWVIFAACPLWRSVPLAGTFARVILQGLDGGMYAKLLWRFNLKNFRNFLKRSRRSHVIPLNRCILRGEGTWSRHFYFIFNFELSTKFYCLEKRPISFCICSCQNVNTERKLHDASGSPLKMI
jgi:hypothetical protein